MEDSKIPNPLEKKLGNKFKSYQVGELEIDGIQPSLVTSPESVDDLSDALANASQEQLAVAPTGGRSQISVGNPPDRLDMILDVSRVNRVLEHNPADLTVTVEAGITFATLQNTLNEHGQFLAIDPPLPRRATIGGTLARGVAGPMTWQGWSPRDLTIGMRIVLASGKFSNSGGKVVKNVSGYDLARLHIGGLGTLGVIAEASFKLTPLPLEQATAIAVFNTDELCQKAAEGVLKRGVTPLAITTLNTVSSNLVSLHGSIINEYSFLVRVGGRPKTLARQLNEIRNVCEKLNPSQFRIVDEDETMRIWDEIRDFGWNEKTRPTVGCRASVLPSQVGCLIKNLEVITAFDNTPPALLSHPAYGTVSVGWFGETNEPSEDALYDMISKARLAAHKSGGNITVEQCPTRI
ncbi:MAG: FAD-binding oxidoreductase, partial [SAR202 cluster bacterium]|nr:FAD-binding oxidoreductase [SAR202 cluster bacterium]